MMEYSQEKYPFQEERYQIIGICMEVINLCPNIKNNL